MDGMAALGIDPDDYPSASELSDEDREREYEAMLERDGWVERYSQSLGWSE